MIRLLIFLVIAFICGAIGANLAGTSKKGCLATIVVGYFGAWIGGYLSRKFGIPDIIVIRGIPVLWAILGSAILVAVISLIAGDGKKD